MQISIYGYEQVKQRKIFHIFIILIFIFFGKIREKLIDLSKAYDVLHKILLRSNFKNCCLIFLLLLIARLRQICSFQVVSKSTSFWIATF